MLDLDAGVHLEEEVLALTGEESFDRARAAVPDGARRLDGDLADASPQLLVHGGRRRLLDELLVTALDRAVPLAEVNGVAVGVGQHLHLHVPRVLQVPLDVDRRVGEVGLALAPRGVVRSLGLVGASDDLEALAPASRGRLDHERPPELRPEAQNLLGRGDRCDRSRNDGDAGPLDALARGRLRAHQLDRFRRRADPDEPGPGDCTGKWGVLGEKPVSGVNGLGAGPLGDLDDPLLLEVTLGRRPGADQVRLVRRGYVEGAAVDLGVDGHGRDLELAQRPEHADGNLAAVRHENLREGRHGPYSPCAWASPTS